MSCPKWFAPGSQQDCSEFLLYFFDRLESAYSKLRAPLKVTPLSMPTVSNFPPADTRQNPEDIIDGKSKTDIKAIFAEKTPGKRPRSDLRERDSDEGQRKLPDYIASSNPADSSMSRATSQNSKVMIENECHGLLDDKKCDASVSCTETKSIDKHNSETPQIGAAVQPHEEDWADPTQIFTGTMRLTSRCGKCGNKSHKLEKFNNLSLAFPTNSTVPTTAENPTARPVSAPDTTSQSIVADKQLQLDQMLEAYLAPEQLDGANLYDCPRCKRHQIGSRQLKITTTPASLILSLMRFAYDPKTQLRSKILAAVEVPSEVSHCPRHLCMEQVFVFFFGSLSIILYTDVPQLPDLTNTQ